MQEKKPEGASQSHEDFLASERRFELTVSGRAQVERIIVNEIGMNEGEKQFWLGDLWNCRHNEQVSGHEGFAADMAASKLSDIVLHGQAMPNPDGSLPYKGENSTEAKERAMKLLALVIFAEGNCYFDLNGKTYDKTQHGTWQERQENSQE